jgi:endonuclease-3
MPESNVKKNTRALKIIDILSREYPGAGCHLHFINPFQLLISTILAAQCTDERVNMVMDELYKKYKTPADFVNASQVKLEKEFGSINFYRNKTKSVQNCSRAVAENFGGEVPKTMDELTSLPGVGRKTANVILGNCFGVPAIMTDTHLNRVSQRLGLTDNDNPDKIESDLVRIIPGEKQTLYSHVIGEHGRSICKAKKPLCPGCVINTLCPSNGKV